MGIGINGLWRWRSANYDINISGGAGTKDLFVVAPTANKFSSNKDETERNWELRSVAHSATPAGVTAYRKVGEVDWSGTEITALRQTAVATSGAQIEVGALSQSGDITWTQESNGAWIPQLKANSVGSNEIAENAVGASELANLSVDTEALIDLAVVTAKVAAQAITEAKLGPLAVGGTKIAAIAVGASKIAAEAVVEEKIAVFAVTTEKIKLLAVTSAILAAEAVTGAKIGVLAVTAAKIAAEAVETGKIQNLAVTAAKIAEEAVSTLKIANLAVTASKIAAEAVETAKIQNLAVTEPKLADAAVTSRKFKPTSGLLQLSETKALTEALVDMPGLKLEITPAVASIILVTITATFLLPSGASIGRAVLVVDGVEQEDGAEHLTNGAAGGEAPMAVQVYRVALTAAPHIVKVQARKNVGGGEIKLMKHGGPIANGGGSNMMYVLHAS